jgi:RimJ/RimL family protein N-acetyltransferase
MAVDAAAGAIGPVTLQGRHVRLEPLSLAHLPGLTAAGADPAIWQWLSVTGATPEKMKAFVQDALEAQARGIAVPFAVFEQASGEIVGSTRFGMIERAHRRAEIGWTWLNPRVQRTAINTEQKYLMLRQAFEHWGLMRVEFKTHVLNEKSRRAIARIGATQEGILRQHMIGHDGRSRDTVYFSILDREWPAVKHALEQKLGSESRSQVLDSAAAAGGSS